MSSFKRSNNSNAHINNSNDTNDNNETCMRSSAKRPRAPIACFRCHHKKVRCDGAHPNCTRCLSTGVLCAYPSSRRSRTTQPTNVDPFIDNLSHLETRIRRIESDLEKQRNLVQSITTSPNTIENNTDEHNRATAAKDLSSKVIKTEMEVQDSRSILAQLRLRGEQRISRNKRAAATTASPTPESITRTPSSSILAKQAKLKSNNSSNTKQPNLKSTSNRTNSHAKFNHQSSTATTTIDNTLLYASCNYETTSNNKGASLSPSFYFQGMMLAPYDYPPPPGHGMDWTLFDQDSQKQQIELVYHPHHTSKIAQQEQAINDLFTPDYNSMFQDMSASPTSTRSSSLVSHLGGGYPATLHPSNSTGSTASNMTGLSSTTSCSSINTCDNNIFNFSMDDIMLQSSSNLMESGQQDVLWYYSS